MNLEELKNREPTFLEAARRKVNGRRTWVCPNCGNGKGRDGDGISLDPHSKNSPHYKCFKCGLYGDVIDLFRYHKGFSDNSEAFKAFCDYYGQRDIGFRNSYKSQNKARRDGSGRSNEFHNGNVENTPQRALNALERAIPSEGDFSKFFEQASQNIDKTDYHRNISLETLRRFKVGFVENWKHPKTPNSGASPRLIIPTGNGSYLARSTVDESKIKVGKVQIFNVEALRTARQPVFVVEGEIDALSIIDLGFEAIALGSTSNVDLLLRVMHETISIDEDVNIISREDASTRASKLSFVLALDEDEAGRKATDKLAEELSRLNFPFYRTDGLYGDFKDANEALTHSRQNFTSRLEKTLQDAVNRVLEGISAERNLYLQNSAANYVDDFINGVHNRANTTCIPTGFSQLDAVLDGGLFEGLYVFGAISSLGKTTLVLQIADQIAQQQQNVLIFSLEMARAELMAKSISRLTLLSGNHRNAKTTRGITVGSRYADYSVQELETINRAVEKYRSYAQNIFIHEGIGDIGTAQIREEIARHMRVTGRKPVVVIDYVQILAPADIRATDKQNTDKAVLELKRISRDFKLPILGISSFNRTSYREAVTMSAFKESGSLEYGSDVLIGLQLKGAGSDNFDVDAAKQVDPRQIELVILKNRNGATGAHLDFNYYAKFNYFDVEK